MLLEAEALNRRKHNSGTCRAAHISAAEKMLPSYDSLDSLLHDARPSGGSENYNVLGTKKRYYNPSIKPSGRHYYGQPGELGPAAGPAKCSVDRAAYQPEWSGVPNWWNLKADDNEPLGMAGGR